MLNYAARLLAAVAVCAMMSGCIESVFVIKVNQDGSGEILERTFMSPQITQMMDGMGGMMSGLAEGLGAEAGATAEAAEPKGFEAMVAEKTADQAKRFGDTAKHEDTKFVTNKEGWKGYVARFSFSDISAIDFNTNESEKEEAEAEGAEVSMGGDMNMESPEYTFSFTKGSPSILKVIPSAVEEEDAGKTTEEPAEGAPEDAMADMMAGGMLQAMSGMFKGMRVTMLLQTETPIKETNASFRHPTRDNVITLMDLKMDSVMANPQAMKALEKNDMTKLAEMQLDGVKLENPSKTLEVKF